MLEPDYLSNITLELEGMYYNLETEIIKDIAERIKLNNYNMTSTAEYQKAVLQSLGKSQSQIIDEISKTLNISKRKVKDIIASSSYRSVEADNEIFELAFKEGKIPSFNYNKESLKAIINSGIKALNTELSNICKTTAKSCQNAFIQASNEAYLAIQSGAFSYDQAITNVVKKLSRQGLGVIEYRSGARRRLDGAIRNAVRTAINQTACKCQDKNFFDMGGNLVEVTSHAGARPAHAEWQGQIYWRKEKYKNYRNFEQTTGYGTGEGLGGWNCRHSFYPYFEGLSTPSFEKYNLKENEEYYNLNQKQRYNERMIREWDRRNQICKSAGVDNSKESAKVREWKKRQTDFLREHPELKRVYAQEKGYINTKETNRTKLLKKDYDIAVNTGQISALVKFQTYVSVANKVEKELVGITTKYGEIKSYSGHFINRIIGQYEESNKPLKGKRKGVSIETVKNCLIKPTKIGKIEVSKNGEKSVRFESENCMVTINPDNCNLIQTNPNHKKGE
ncbi:phage minor capsid protein [Thomasclavelia cocleata]|uniref:phage minor capsid protein n=1 Tax=Thomasclavelia cocleata TaxID=69824 RepID=UPI0024331B7F|nr:phage minor capsid protein [Thomasclavelia cocleata]